MSAELVPSITESSLSLVSPAYALAERIASTEFVPSALRNKPDAVLAAILTGHELGIGPMQSLSKIHVIEGRPAMAAELMRALVLAAGHEVWVVEANNTRCTMGAKRAGSSRESSFTWTMDDAKRAGLEGRTNWRKYPRAMLLARATSEVIRAVFPDVVAGVSYSVEELSDGDLFNEEDVPAPATTGKKARAKRAATAPPEIVGASEASLPAEATTSSDADDGEAEGRESVPGSGSPGAPEPAPSPAAVPPELVDYSGDPF
jgi:hypothetical protein